MTAEVSIGEYWGGQNLPVEHAGTPSWATRTEIDRDPWQTTTRHTYRCPIGAVVDAAEELGVIHVELTQLQYAEPGKPDECSVSSPTVRLNGAPYMDDDLVYADGTRWGLYEDMTVAQARRLRDALDDVLTRLDQDGVGNPDYDRDDRGRRSRQP